MDTLAYPIFSAMSALIRLDFGNAMDDTYERMCDSVVTIALLIETFFILRAGYIIVGSKTTEDEKNPDLQELLYHGLVICGVISIFKSHSTMPLDFIIALKSMMIDGLTNSSTKGGKQVADALVIMDTAYAFSNVANSVSVSDTASSLKSTIVTLALTTQVTPTITGGLLLLFNELMVRVGTALFPLVAYAALYKTTRDIFMTWMGLMLALGLLMATSAVTTIIAAKVTVAFVIGFAAIVALQKVAPIGAGFYISEIQQALIQGGFGFTVTIIMLNFPVNAANFAGGYLQFAGPTTNNELGAMYNNKREYKKR